MPTPGEAFIIVLIVLVVSAAARLLTLGDTLGGALRSLVGKNQNNEPS